MWLCPVGMTLSGGVGRLCQLAVALSGGYGSAECVRFCLGGRGGGDPGQTEIGNP